jgi:hypothetical protein
MKFALSGFLIVIMISTSALAVSISPEIIQALQASGQLDEIILQDKMVREMGVWEANPDPFRFGVTADLDTLNCLIILADFDDMPHENGLDTEPADFDTLRLLFRNLLRAGISDRTGYAMVQDAAIVRVLC